MKKHTIALVALLLCTASASAVMRPPYPVKAAPPQSAPSFIVVVSGDARPAK
jgi:hypothetical protein